MALYNTRTKELFNVTQNGFTIVFDVNTLCISIYEDPERLHIARWGSSKGDNKKHTGSFIESIDSFVKFVEFMEKIFGLTAEWIESTSVGKLIFLLRVDKKIQPKNLAGVSFTFFEVSRRIFIKEPYTETPTTDEIVELPNIQNRDQFMFMALFLSEITNLRLMKVPDAFLKIQFTF